MADPSLSTSTDIQRVLFLGRVHCYAIPPLQANKGHKASDWRIEDPKSVIFTARIRVIESAAYDGANVKTDIRLEDSDTGDLFANGPYEGAYCVTPVLDSSRFFALRVVDGPRKAFLGIGFEERSDAFDFGVCLQEVRRHNNLDGEGLAAAAAKQKKEAEDAKKDYSLKEGQTINITIGNKGRRRPQQNQTTEQSPSFSSSTSSNNNDSSLPLPFLPPPPSAEDVKKKRQSLNGGLPSPPPLTYPPPSSSSNSAHQSGFDDDPFGDFV